MDKLMLDNLVNANDPVLHAKALAYYDELKNSEQGWKECLQTVVSGQYANVAQVQFFCMQVIEYHVRNRFNNSSPQDQELVRKFLREWIELQTSMDGRQQENFILNKAAQISALVFVQDYPSRWPEFFTEHIALGERSPQFLGHYLRVLLSIDGEVADKEIPRTAMELQRNSLIKDAMREKAVIQLVESWYKILTSLTGSYANIIRLCMQVIGKYIQWIDINLVANDRFVPVLVSYMCKSDIRESAADCIQEVISKGMDPIDKTKLVQSFSRVLGDAGIWHAILSEEQDEDYLVRLGKLFGTMGTNLIDSYSKFAKSHPGKEAELTVILEAVEEKLPLMMQLLGSEYDEVSGTVLDFARDYLHLIKSIRLFSETQVSNYRTLLEVIIRKLRYDASYDFNHEGEDEADFMEYRKQLKVLFDNVAQLDKTFVIVETQNRIQFASQNWRGLPFDEVEVSLLLMYYLGESLPSAMTCQWNATDGQPNPIQSMMLEIVNSDIYMYDHSAVVLQFFETIIRYEKFFVSNPQCILKGLTAFLKEKGLFNPDKKVRSRCCYLFSRFIKCIRSGITSELMNFIVDAIQPLLALNLMPKEAMKDCLITRDDQLYLYEVVGVLIVSGECENAKKTALMTDIVNLVLYPCRMGIEKLKTIPDDHIQQEVTVELLVQAIALTGRLSKAFSNQHSMKSLSCVQLFLDALGVFLQILELPLEESLMAQLQSSVRQYLHRLVVCLEEELLPYIPAASQSLLKNCDCRSIQEYLPLINQVIIKFKKDVVPFLKQMFTPMVQGVFQALQIPIEPNDQIAHRDRQLLRRQYFQFIATIVTHNVTDVLAAQDPSVLQNVMLTVIQGSVDFPDPVAQKACFSILKKFVELWAGPEGPEGFIDFMYKNIVPACFIAPLKVSFDINDAQTVIALNEVAGCLKSIFEKRKEEFVSFLLGYLPTLKLSVDKSQGFVNALQADNKSFRVYLKNFFVYLKPIAALNS